MEQEDFAHCALLHHRPGLSLGLGRKLGQLPAPSMRPCPSAWAAAACRSEPRAPRERLAGCSCYSKCRRLLGDSWSPPPRHARSGSAGSVRPRRASSAGGVPSRSEPSGGLRLLRELHSDAASTHRGCWPARRGSCKSWPAAETTSTSWTSGERIVHTYRCSLLGLIRLGLGFLCSYVPDAESNFMPSSAAATSASARSLATTVTSDDIPFPVWKRHHLLVPP